MSLANPRSGCYDLAFRAAWPLGETSEVALEDYARTVTRSDAAEAVRSTSDPSEVVGVHVCGLGAAFTAGLLQDVEDFARDLAKSAGQGGLGWS
jgi:hypothetical protein